MSAVFDRSEGARISTTTFIRVIALSIAFYDYILTLPAEWRFYRSQRSWRLSPGCILFIAIRYSSIAVLLVSNIGYFGNFFTPESCQRYFLAAPVLKVIQAMVSQLILGIRAVNISRRSTWVTWTIVATFIVVTAAEWFLNLWNRVFVQGRLNDCTAGNKPPVLTVWLFYVCAMIYDLVTLVISTGYLVSFGPNSGSMARLVKIMLTDGLVYFVALTGINILNLILYRSSDESVQSSGVSLGYAMTWIMSQRILIHLRDAAAAHNRTVTTQIIVSRPLPSAYSVSHAMRSQFESKSRDHLSTALDLEWSLPSHSFEPPHSPPVVSSHVSSKRWISTSGNRPTAAAVHQVECSGRTAESALDQDVERRVGIAEGGRGREDAEEGFAVDVEVKVEETVTVEYDPEAFGFETYRTPRLMWGNSGNGHAQVRAVKSSSGDGDGAAGT